MLLDITPFGLSSCPLGDDEVFDALSNMIHWRALCDDGFRMITQTKKQDRLFLRSRPPDITNAAESNRRLPPFPWRGKATDSF